MLFLEGASCFPTDNLLCPSIARLPCQKEEKKHTMGDSLTQLQDAVDQVSRQSNRQKLA